jgi:hypothetical protein
METKQKYNKTWIFSRKSSKKREIASVAFSRVCISSLVLNKVFISTKTIHFGFPEENPF